MLGKIPLTRVRPVIRVFVSSTFSDLKHERNALQIDVFPKLEQLCLQRDFQFQAIDLRWGVSTEAGLDHRTMRICFEELRRSQEVSPLPNFLILLGDRYGWRPLPEEVSMDEFQMLEANARELDGGTTDGQSVNVLRQWYLCDANAIPAVYVLRSRRQRIHDGSGDYTEESTWRDVQSTLWRVINATWPATELATRFEHLPPSRQTPASALGTSIPETALPPIVRFQASATEQEIWHGALKVPNANEHVVTVIRKIDNLEHVALDPRSRDFVDLDDFGRVNPVAQDALHQLQDELHSRLNYVYVANGVALNQVVGASCQSQLDVTTGHLTELCHAVLTRLETIIRQQMDDYWQTPLSAGAAGVQSNSHPTARELDLERDAHRHFADERAPVDGIVGREAETDAILDYLARDDSRFLVVHGASGSGKTALLAHAAREAAQRHVSHISIIRFLGTTAKSSDLRSLLINLCCELRQSYPIDRIMPADIREFVQEFYDQLGRATVDRPIYVFLDALDQLEDSEGARQLTWLRSTPLPPHARLVVSCLSSQQDDGQVTAPYSVLKRRGLLANQVLLSGLTPDEARMLLFDNWLRRAGRTVNSGQRQSILDRIQPESASESRSPLYLKILFEEVKLWRSYDEQMKPGGSVSELLSQLCQRLSKPENHGESLVRFVLGYLAAARRGLSEKEILEVLFADPDYKHELDEVSLRNNHVLPAKPPRIPIAIWSRLRSDLAPYLSERSAPGGDVLSFYHLQVAEWITASFIDQSAWNPHERLADYMASQSLSDRKIDELPWQLREAKQWQRIYDLLSDIPFFLAVWNANEFDVKRYWTAIESNSNLRLLQAFHSVIAAPAQHERAAWALTLLLGDKGQRTETQSLREWQVKHYREIDDPRALARCLISLGDSLQARGDYERARRLYDEADQICRRLGDREELATCLGSQALLHEAQGRLDEAVSLLDRQAEICHELPTNHSLQYNLGHKARICFLQGRFQEAMTLALEQEQVALEQGNVEVVAAALGCQSKVLEARNKPDSAVRLCRQRQQLWRELGNPEMLAIALCDQALIDQKSGNVNSALSLYQQARDLTRGLPDADVDLNACHNEAVLRETLRDFSGAMQLYRESEIKSRRFDKRAQLARSLSNQVDILIATNNLCLAMEKAREAEQISRETENAKSLAFALGKRSRVYFAQRDFRQALLLLQECERLLEDVHDTHGQAHNFHNQAVVHAVAGDFRKSRSTLEREAEILRGLGQHPEELVQCLQMQADVALAHANSLPNLGPVGPSASLREQFDRAAREGFIERVRECRREIGRIGRAQAAAGGKQVVARTPTPPATLHPLFAGSCLCVAAWAAVAHYSWMLVIAIPMTAAMVLFGGFVFAWLHGHVISVWCSRCGNSAWKFRGHYWCRCNWKNHTGEVPLDPQRNP